MKISEKYTISDITRSQTATQMGYQEQFTPPQEVIDAASLVCNQILDKIPYPFVTNSFYRCQRLNKRVGGSKTSDHMKGQAVDIDTRNDANNALIYNWIKDNLEFDQLIWEYGDDTNPDWVHVSFRKTGNRNQTLRIK